ncbi:hypothetical protein LINPERHAP2_LOCUS24978 [Linum perenne]
MATPKPSDAASDRAKWDAIFTATVKLVKNQRWQLQTLLTQREFLHDRFKKQNETSASNYRAYQLHISELESRLEEKEVERVMEAARSELLVRLKSREALVHKVKLDETKDELADFVALFDYLSTSFKNSAERNEGDTRCSSDSKTATNSEVQRLTLEYKKLAFEKTALSREKSFITNQLNILETNLTKKLKDKQAEADQSHAKMAQVFETAEQLQCCNIDKDETIEELKARVSEMEEEGHKWEDKVSKLSQELEGLKNKSQVGTPVLRSCNEERDQAPSSPAISTSGKDCEEVHVTLGKQQQCRGNKQVSIF